MDVLVGNQMLEPPGISIRMGTQTEIGAVYVAMVLEELIALHVSGTNQFPMLIPTIHFDSSAHCVSHKFDLACEPIGGTTLSASVNARHWAPALSSFSAPVALALPTFWKETLSVLTSIAQTNLPVSSEQSSKTTNLQVLDASQRSRWTIGRW